MGTQSHLVSLHIINHILVDELLAFEVMKLLIQSCLLYLSVDQIVSRGISKNKDDWETYPPTDAIETVWTTGGINAGPNNDQGIKGVRGNTVTTESTTEKDPTTTEEITTTTKKATTTTTTTKRPAKGMRCTLSVRD